MSIVIDRRTIRPNREDFGYGTGSHEYNQTKRIVRSYNIIWFIVGFIDALLGFRFVFEILGANPYNEFTQLVYTLSYPVAQPFRSIFGITSVANSYFDWSVLLAMIVYLLIGYGLVQLLRIINPITRDDMHHRMVI
jgi:uncharacterized protein YggT (Ycf19 family)